MPNLTCRRHPDFASHYVVQIGYQIVERDGKFIEVEFGRFGRQGVSGRIDLNCYDTDADYGFLKSFKIVVENVLKCLQGFGLVKVCKKEKAEVEHRIPLGMKDRIDC